MPDRAGVLRALLYRPAPGGVPPALAEQGRPGYGVQGGEDRGVLLGHYLLAGPLDGGVDHGRSADRHGGEPGSPGGAEGGDTYT